MGKTKTKGNEIKDNMILVLSNEDGLRKKIDFQKKSTVKYDENAWNHIEKALNEFIDLNNEMPFLEEQSITLCRIIPLGKLFEILYSESIIPSFVQHINARNSAINSKIWRIYPTIQKELDGSIEQLLDFEEYKLCINVIKSLLNSRQQFGRSKTELQRAKLYCEAQILYDLKKYREALDKFVILQDYRDGNEMRYDILERFRYTNKTNVQPGDIVKIGNYASDLSHCRIKYPLLWTVYKKDEKTNTIWLLCRYVIDSKTYIHSGKYRNGSFKNSDIICWLNSSFYQSAFNHKEQEAILLYNFECTYQDQRENIDKSEIVKKKIALLSIKDFTEFNDYIGPIVGYPISLGDFPIYTYGRDNCIWGEETNETEFGRCHWWLRDKSFDGSATYVNLNGNVDHLRYVYEGNGMIATQPEFGDVKEGIRPIIVVDLNKI